MADTGAPWNIPYAEPADLVRAWPALSEDVADAVAAGLDAAGAGIGTNTVQTVLADTFSTSSSSYVDLTGLAVTITPSVDTAKVLLMVSVNHSNAANNTINLGLKRGTTELIVPTSPGSRTVAWSANRQNFTGASNLMTVQNFVFLDSPATDTATTYQVTISTGGTVFVNRSTTDDNNSGFPRGVSTITAIEVTV
jgi:hypothetical protein